MKKLLTGVIVMMLACFISGANAQIGFGIMGGINLANITGETVDDLEDLLDAEYGNRLGILGGGFLSFPLGDNLKFRPEVLYSQKGAKMDEDDFLMEMKIDYIEIPLLLQYCIPVQGSIMPFILGGGYLAFNMSANQKVEVLGVEVMDDDIKDDINSLDYGVVFGAGVLINELIEIGARYSMGLANAVKEDVDVEDMGLPADTEVTIKNKAIQIYGAIYL